MKDFTSQYEVLWNKTGATEYSVQFVGIWSTQDNVSIGFTINVPIIPEKWNT